MLTKDKIPFDMKKYIEHDVKSADIYVSVYDHKCNFVKR